MPRGRSSSTRLATFASGPVTSTITESVATSTIRGPEISTRLASSANPAGELLTRMSARSRSTVGRWVTSTTSATGMSLRRFASTIEAGTRAVSTTIVIRENSGVSVCPTVRLSMLKARLRKRLATRSRTPGWSMTFATRVCFTTAPPLRPRKAARIMALRSLPAGTIG